jgi:hypothetical protein
MRSAKFVALGQQIPPLQAWWDDFREGEEITGGVGEDFIGARNRDEKEHDLLLIELVRELDRLGRIDILERAFGVARLGPLERAQRRKLFDVELTFDAASLAVETKVDSDEGGRWNQVWQTDRIYAANPGLHYLKPTRHFLLRGQRGFQSELEA